MTPGLFEAAAATPALLAAWQDLLDGDRSDGVLSQASRRFAAHAEESIAELAEQLRKGTYRPSSLTEVVLPGEAGHRVLQVPSVRDRVVEKALVAVMTPVIDPVLGPSSFAYRPGLGVADAVQAVARLRDEGLPWVACTDIDDCFPTVQIGRLRRMLAVLIDDTVVLDLLDTLFARNVARRGGWRRLAGLAQGSPLSPMPANLMLEQLDDRVRGAGFPLVRYADDLAVCTASEAEAYEALRIIAAALEGIGMSAGPDKTEVMSFADGFCFLGEDFGPRYPVALEEHRVIEPAAKTAYVGVSGSRVHIDQGRLKVDSPDDVEILSVPGGHVERLVCFGPVGLSAGARSWALTNQVEVIFASRRGNYLGQLLPGAVTRVDRLRNQLRAADTPETYLPFARAVIAAKIHKQATLLQRSVRRDGHEQITHEIAMIRQLLAMIADAGSRDEIMGVEGAAARSYFAALSLLVSAELRFTGRSRQPPMDLVNAALSFGYTILLGEATCALVSAGLDPAIGLLHTEQYRRPSLTLDIIEEFRPLIVDQVVISAARRAELRPEHGRTDTDRPGVLLTRAGRETFFTGYERRMLQITRGALPGFAGSLRRHLYRQAQRLANHISEPNQPWTGLSWR